MPGPISSRDSEQSKCFRFSSELTSADISGGCADWAGMFGTKGGQNRNWPTLHNTTVVLLWAAVELLQVLQPAYDYQNSVACLWDGMASLQTRRPKVKGDLPWRKRKVKKRKGSRLNSQSQSASGAHSGLQQIAG